MSARPVGTWFLIAAGIAVAASIVAAIAVIGAPSHQRAKRFDERRVHDLTVLHNAIERHGRSEQRLPNTLAELRRPDGNAFDRTDPQTGQPYDYRVLDARRYELCATFATERTTRDASESHLDEWLHPAGRHCFTHSLPRAGGPARTREDVAAERTSGAEDTAGTPD